MNFPELPSETNLPLFARPRASQPRGPDMTLPFEKKALRVAPSSAFRSFIPAARNWKTGSSVKKKTLNFLRHMRLTSWRIWRARDIILYFTGREFKRWHFAQFYIIRRMYKWSEESYFANIENAFGWRRWALSVYKISGRQLFRLCSRKSITGWLLTCFHSARVMFSIRKIWPRHTAGISISKSGNINFVVITR